MNFDKILNEIGGSGPAQYIIAVSAFISQGLICINTYLHMFMQGDDHYRCNIPNCDNSTSLEYQHDWLNLTIPWVHDEKTNKITMDRCHMFTPNATGSDGFCDIDGVNRNSTLACTSYVYESQHSNLIKEWELTCGRKYLLTLSMSIFMAGFLFGVYTFGYISDRFGRRKSILSAVVIQLLCNIAIVFSVNFYMYAVLRFIIAATGIGIMSGCYVLVSEVIGTKNRNIIAVASSGWQFSEFLLVGLAYAIHDWRYLQGTASILSLLYLLFFWIVLESPRWLISQGRYEEAKVTIKRFAKWQKKEVPEDLLKVEESDEKQSDQKKLSPADLFRTYVIRKRTIIISIIWFFDSLIGYAISLGAKNMPGSLYINFMCLATGDVIGAIALVYLLKYSRRMLWLCFGMLAVGVISFCNLAVAPDAVYVIAALAMLGRTAITITFNMTYVYTAELFPTPLRSTALGTGSMFSRVGGILAPFVASLVDVWRPLPVLIMGTCGFIGSAIIILLPETLNKPLPSTIAEIESTRNEPGNFTKLKNKISGNKQPRQQSIVLRTISKKDED